MTIVLLLVWAATSGAAQKSSEPSNVRDVVLPDADGPRPAILDLGTGEFSPVPSPSKFQNHDAYLAALRSAGDVVFDNADGGQLYVTSGSSAALHVEDPASLIGADLMKQLEERDRLQGDEIVPGRWLLIRTQRGQLALVRVISRAPRSLRIRWAIGDDRTLFSDSAIRVLAAEVVEPTLAFGSVRLAPLGVAGASVLRIRDGRAVAVPAESVDVRPPANVLELVSDPKLGDLAYLSSPQPRVLVPGGRTAIFGIGSLQALEGRDLSQRLHSSSILSARNLPVGSAFMIETKAEQSIIFRVDRMDDDALEMRWVIGPGGRAVFGDLEAVDVAVAQLDTAALSRQLVAAIRQSRVDRAVILLARGADPNWRTESGRSLLLEAIMSGSFKIVDALVGAGAAVDYADTNGWTPLHYAAKLGRPDMVDLLLEHGADPARKTEDGETALELAQRSPRQSKEVQRALKATGVLADSLSAVALDGDVKRLRVLLAGGKNVDEVFPDGRTAAHVAAAHGNVSVLTALVEAGADLTIRAERSGTPIEAAAYSGHVDAVEVLVRAGASGDAMDAALFGAAMRSDPEMTRLLLDSGADPDEPHGRPYSSVEQAFLFGEPEVVDVYVQRGYEQPAWSLARMGRVDELERMIRRGSDVAAAGPDGRTPIEHATSSGDPQSLEQLLRSGVSPNLRTQGWGNKTLMHLAVDRGSSEIVDVLIDADQPLDEVDSTGHSPLYYAVILDREQIAGQLLKRGADPNRPLRGDSLLELSLSESLRKLLVDHGAR